MPTQFYVTNEGLAAGLADPEILQTLRGILLDHAHPMTIKAFMKRGLVAQDKRTGTRADHNTLILTGAVERVREVLLPPAPDGIATQAKRPVRYVTQDNPRASLTPTVQKVYDAFKATGGGTYAELSDHALLKGMNPGTLRWAIQQLRQRGLVENAQLANAA